MIIREAAGARPTAAPTARGAENCALVGDVRLGEKVTIWYGAVLRGDVGPILVGDGTNIQDNCVVHCGIGEPATLGKNVVVGHGAILHSCTVEDGCLIGMGATVLDGAVIGAGSMVAAGALVSPGKVIPPRSLVVGVPGKVLREVTEREMELNLLNAEHYVELGAEQLGEFGEEVIVKSE